MSCIENMENFQEEGVTSEDSTNKTTAFIKQYQLTPREVDVLALLVAGKANAEIASVLSLSKKCIEYHLRNLYGKLGVKSRVNAIGGGIYDKSSNAYATDWQIWSPQKFGLEVNSCGGPSYYSNACLPKG